MSTNAGYVTLMIITDTSKSPTAIKFSRMTFRIILAALALLAVGIIVGGVTYSQLLTHSMEREKLVAEVKELKRYSAKVDELEKNLVVYRQMLKKMTDLAGIDLSEFGMATVDNSSVATEDQALRSRNPGLARHAQAHPTPHGFPVKGYLSRSFRPEDENPIMRHFGVDLAVSAGTPVTATADGEVTFAGWDSTFGWKVMMSHADSIETMYGHNDSLLVKVGDVKRFGEVIAISGNTGISTAPHVHYEIRKNGNPISPEENYDERK